MIQTLLLFLILVVLIIKTFTIKKTSGCKYYYEKPITYYSKIKCKREVIYFYLVIHRGNKIYKFKIFTSKGIKEYE